MILWFSVLIFGSITVLVVSAHFVKTTLRSLLLLGDFGLGVMMPRTQEMLVPILPSWLPECYFACGAGRLTCGVKGRMCERNESLKQILSKEITRGD